MFIPSEDFWSRQTNVPKFHFEFAPLGTPAAVTTNDEAVLAAVKLSASRFSCWDQAMASSASMRVHIVVRDQATEPLPPDLPERLVYAGIGEWITVSAGEWGHGFANLLTHEANVFLSPALAAHARLVSRYFVDHYVLNFLLTNWAMLHASCVLRHNHLIVMVASHNVGKSTTALRLLRAGYTFLADGMVLIKESAKEKMLVVGGYPIGEVKLRDDVLALFPEYAGERVQVREHHKTIVNLRRTHPGQLVETVITPSAIHVCLAERVTDHVSRITPMRPAEAEPILAANTVFWDEPQRLAHNIALLNQLMQTAHFHRLSIGTDTDSLVNTLEKLS